MTESGLADYIRKHLPQNDTPLRLNSCSDLESAKLFSKEFPNREVYATDAIVNVHADGGITVTARPPSNNQEWRKLKNGEDVGNAPTPTQPSGQVNKDKYVSMGLTKTDFDASLHFAFDSPYLINGLKFENYEMNAVNAYYKKYGKANGKNFLDEYRELTNKIDPALSVSGKPKYLSSLLAHAYIDQDISKLEGLLKAIHKTMDDVNDKFTTKHKEKLDKILAGHASTVAQRISDLPIFMTKTVDDALKPSIFSASNSPFEDINMQHILDKHTIKYFLPTPYNMDALNTATTKIDFFPPGTSQVQVCALLDEALEKAKTTYFGGVLPTKAQIIADYEGNWSKILTLVDGKTYRLGFTTKSNYKALDGTIPYNSKYIIGQFYPEPSPDLRSIDFLQLLVNTIKP